MRFEARGRVRAGRRLGRVGDPDLDFAGLCDLHGLPRELSAGLPARGRGRGARGRRRVARLDLRALPFVTIDPLRARDHDDAVFAERRGSGFGLWVAIADVSQFVPAASALDREARKRGNSVYLPERVVPMLPERLSGDLCSLRPEQERLALAVELAVDADGDVAPPAGRRRAASARGRSSPTKRRPP